MTSAKAVPQECMDFERVMIYPMDRDKRTRHEPYITLQRPDVHYEAESWD